MAQKQCAQNYSVPDDLQNRLVIKTSILVTNGIQQKVWQGKKDSNLRMLESKSSALTNLAIPLHD
jgi:hypothetical protein